MQLPAGDAVDRCVVHLRQHADAAVGESLDQVELPQRAAAVQRPGDDATDLLGENGVVTWGGQREFADVEVDVEVGIVEPVGVVESERHFGQPPAKRREAVQPSRDQRAQCVACGRAVRGGGRVVDAQSADVAVGAPVLQCEELGIGARQLTHIDHEGSGARRDRNGEKRGVRRGWKPSSPRARGRIAISSMLKPSGSLT